MLLFGLFIDDTISKDNAAFPSRNTKHLFIASRKHPHALEILKGNKKKVYRATKTYYNANKMSLPVQKEHLLKLKLELYVPTEISGKSQNVQLVGAVTQHECHTKFLTLPELCQSLTFIAKAHSVTVR